MYLIVLIKNNKIYKLHFRKIDTEHLEKFKYPPPRFL